jgi:hypothetical protein
MTINTMKDDNLQLETDQSQPTQSGTEGNTAATNDHMPSQAERGPGLPEGGNSGVGEPEDAVTNQTAAQSDAAVRTPEVISGPTSEKASTSGCSERKRQSNRTNSGKSTGPRTARGKNISRQNALKHGALVKKVLFDQQGRFCSQDLRVLFDQLCDEFGADTVRKRILVESMVVVYRRNVATVEIENAMIKSNVCAAVTPEGARVQRYAAANLKSMLSLLEQLEESKQDNTSQDDQLEDGQGDEPLEDLERPLDSGRDGSEPLPGSPRAHASTVVSEPKEPAEADVLSGESASPEERLDK